MKIGYVIFFCAHACVGICSRCYMILKVLTWCEFTVSDVKCFYFSPVSGCISLHLFLDPYAMCADCSRLMNWFDKVAKQVSMWKLALFTVLVHVGVVL